MSFKLLPNSNIIIGNAAAPGGYCLTICTTAVSKGKVHPSPFNKGDLLDIHLTYEQAKELRQKLDFYLNLIEERTLKDYCNKPK